MVVPKAQQNRIFILLIYLAILCGSQVDIFAPSMNEMRTFFGISYLATDMTLTINIIFLSISALLCGSFVDRYGYRKLTLIGLAFFIIGTSLSTFASQNEYWLMILGRVLQGFGIAAPTVLSTSIIIDIYPYSEQRKILGLFTAAVGASLAFMPTVITYVSAFVHWYDEFFAMFIWAIGGFIASFALLPKVKTRKSEKVSFSSYLPLFHSKKLILYVSIISLIFVIQRIYILSSNELYMSGFNLTKVQMGLHEGIFLLVFISSGVFSGKIFKNLGIVKCFILSALLLSLFIILVIIMLAFSIKNPYMVTLSSVLFTVGRIFPLLAFIPLAFKILPRSKGRIQAFITFFMLVGTTISMQLINHLFKHTFLTYGILIIMLTLLAAYLTYLLYKEENF